MKKFLSFIIALAMTFSVTTICAYADDEQISINNTEYIYTIPSSYYPESPHNYSSYCNLNYGFYYPNAKSLSVTFSSSTRTESGYDYIYIADGENNIIGKYSGTELAGKTINIPTGSFRIAIISDRSKTYYGFSIDKIEANMISNSSEKKDTYSTNYYDLAKPYSSHNYSNNTDETFYYTNPNAKSLTLTFSSSTKTEYNYDFIYIYDGNGKLVGKYSGRQLANEVIKISTNSFSIRLTSDKSYTYYGYSITNIVATYDKDSKGNDNTSYPESDHRYGNNINETYIFDLQYPDIDLLSVKFSSKTYTESNYDFISIYDKNDNLVGKYSGSELASKTVNISGDYFKIVLTSDRSKTYYGFSINSIVGTIYEKEVSEPISDYSVTPLQAGYKVNWNTNSNVSGYEIQYTDDNSFDTYEIEDMPKNSYSQRTFSGYLQDHTYYIRLRTYKYDKSGEKVYSIYSDVKEVKTYPKLKYYYSQLDYDDENDPNDDYSRPSGEKKTIATSGCGVVSTTIALNNMAGYEYYGVTEVAQFSMKHGARDEYGTNLVTLLDELCKYNSKLSYTTTEYGSELINHLKNGGIAIVNQSEYQAQNGYPLFSDGGHYVVAYYADDNNNVYIADPAYSSTRYKTEFRQANIVRETSIGCEANISIINKATLPISYYLLSYDN